MSCVSRVRLDDDVTFVSQRKTGELIVVGQDRDLESIPADPAEPPLETARMEDRARFTPRTRPSDERQ